MANVTQIIDPCELHYDLTAHSLEVRNEYGDLILKIHSLPDTPGEFDFNMTGHSIEIHHPNQVNFHPMHDQFEDNKNAGL